MQNERESNWIGCRDKGVYVREKDVFCPEQRSPGVQRECRVLQCTQRKLLHLANGVLTHVGVEKVQQILSVETKDIEERGGNRRRRFRVVSIGLILHGTKWCTGLSNKRQCTVQGRVQPYPERDGERYLLGEILYGIGMGIDLPKERQHMVQGWVQAYRRRDSIQYGNGYRPIQVKMTNGTEIHQTSEGEGITQEQRNNLLH